MVRISLCLAADQVFDYTRDVSQPQLKQAVILSRTGGLVDYMYK